MVHTQGNATEHIPIIVVLIVVLGIEGTRN
jgi:uncharacterized membrane protein YecN with MAPEG domain